MGGRVGLGPAMGGPKPKPIQIHPVDSTSSIPKSRETEAAVDFVGSNLPNDPGWPELASSIHPNN